MLNHQGTKKLETPRLTLRKFSPNDAQDMFNNWASDPIVTKYLAWSPHPDIETSKSITNEWIKSYKSPETYQWGIEVKDINQVIGTISLMHVNNNSEKCEIGYCIGKSFWSKGIMTEAFKIVIEYAFKEIGFNRIEARHQADNEASGKVMIKCGLQYEGCLRQSMKNNDGKFVDCKHYSILKEEYKDITK